MVGRSTVIEQDLLPVGEGPSCAPLPRNQVGELQSIAIGNYANDHHYPGPDWPLAPKSCRWGGRWTGTPFCIPYGALVSAEIDNLLGSDKAISTSHMANGATRLQPLVLIVGQAAGAAAALAVASGLTCAEVSVRDLQECLINDGQAAVAVVPRWTIPWDHPQWREQQLNAWRPKADRGRDAGLDGVDLAESRLKHVGAKGLHRFEGVLVVEADGSVQLTEADGQTWPLITLEPEIHTWWSLLESPMEVAVLAAANRWGPWLLVHKRVNNATKPAH